jgi:MerR family transcriptional regulator, heat shock protein HspR
VVLRGFSRQPATANRQPTDTMGKRRADGFVMISIIAERYNIHPQTLRLYEREGLIKPARTNGNTRLYGEDEIRKLEMILTLTRDLGVNLAGVEVVLQLARMMYEGNVEFDRLLDYIRQCMLDKRHGIERENALVKAEPQGLARRG